MAFLNRVTTLDAVSEQPSPPEPRGIRISDADRERAAGRLHHALSEGRITLSELEERLAIVYAAKYDADLRPPLADLPGADGIGGPASALAPPPADVPAVVLRAGMSTIKRSGVWDVPPRLRLQSAMGSVVLDFATSSERPRAHDTRSRIARLAGDPRESRPGCPRVVLWVRASRALGDAQRRASSSVRSSRPRLPSDRAAACHLLRSNAGPAAAFAASRPASQARSPSL